MVQTRDEERAEYLAKATLELLDAGRPEEASRSLREALSLAPENVHVKEAFLKLQQDEKDGHQLLDLCRRYITGKDEDAGEEAVRYLRTDGLKPPEDTALGCLKLLLAEKPHTLSPVQDVIISGLVRHNVSVRQFFATRLQDSVTAFFDEIYDRGDGAAVCLDMIVLDPKLWPSEDARSHCERELFLLFIAKLMESGHDLDGRSLKGITRLLAVDAANLQHLVDDEGLDVILSSSDNRISLELRSQATLAMARYLEASKKIGEERFAKLISAKIAKGHSDDLIAAYSAVAVVFPIIPNVMASLFLSKEFVKSLLTSVSRGVKSRSVELSELELLNAACIDRNCREAISKNFSDWLSHLLSNGTDQTSELAAVILAKIRSSEKDALSGSNGKVQEADSSISELVDRFKGLMSKQKVDNIQNAIEGLAYSSMKPTAKEQLAGDSAFLRDLFELLQANSEDSSVLYGGLMVILNLTSFLPKLSEEQKKISQLKSYANASASEAKAGPDPLDDDEHVTTRCAAIVNAGIMPLLVDCGKCSLPSVHGLISKILVSLAADRKNRGKLAQQGAVKLLISIGTPKPGSTSLDETAHHASHALARILISVNPSLVFPSSGVPQITSAIRPLVSLLSPPEQAPISVDQPRDLLPVFESLLALTNLASSPDISAPESIVRQAWAVVEDLLLSNNTLIQRAACELVCNLMTCESGIVKFADGTKRAAQRLQILLALTDAEDIATRRAAGGALAMLTEYDAVIKAILDRPAGMSAQDYLHHLDDDSKTRGPRSLNLLLRLCQEEDGALAHRGVVCIQNLANAPGDTGTFAREVLKASNTVQILTELFKREQQSGNMAALQVAIETLKVLVN